MDINTLCLNMIVKNESKIIKRLFDSVLDIIDCYCICDTGSTDDTINIIKKYFESKNIPGKIIEEPFINFSHNRNIALNECLGMSNYILLLDADMVIKNFKFDKNLLCCDYYYLFQGNDFFNYHNIRIIKNDGYFKYYGYTHEYITYNSPTFMNKNEYIEKDIIFIEDIGDGGSKENKFKRDIELLEKNIIEEPLNTRSYFYLANSYKDINNYDKAITNYKILLDMNGWVQEKYCACYNLGEIYYKLNDINNFIKYCFKSIEYDNERIEGIINLVKYFYDNNIHIMVNLLYKKFRKYDKSPKYKLFLHTDKYNYLLEYYNSISAYYAGDLKSGYKCCKKCIENNVYKDICLENIKYYTLLNI